MINAEAQNLTLAKKKTPFKLKTSQQLLVRTIFEITWKDHKTAKWTREQTELQDIVETIRSY